jgi:hypothetical protein
MPGHFHRCSFLLLVLACQREEALHPAPPPPALTTPAPQFALLTPAVGDTLVEGRTYTIRWVVAQPDRHINIGAVMGGHDKGLLLHNAPSAPGSLVWTVPPGFVTGFGPSSSDQIRLRLENADSTDQWVETGPFVIRGALP